MANTNGTQAIVPAGHEQSESFGERAIVRQAETAAMAVAEQAKAAVQARYIVAMQNRRDLDDVRVRLLKECQRPGFAKVARYRKPIGQGVEGPSIRFAEAAIRVLGNIFVETPTVFDDREKQIVRCTVTDLESNITYTQDIVVEKTVERSKLKEGQLPIGSRTNSQGRTTYLVAATEDDLLNKRAALISKAIRTLGLRVLPGDILDECMQACIQTAHKDDARDPAAAQKQVADHFASLNVTPGDLAKYLGHPLATASPAEIGELRALYSAIRDGEASWADALATKAAAAATDDEEKKPANPAVEKLRAKLEEARKSKGKGASKAAAGLMATLLDGLSKAESVDDFWSANEASIAKLTDEEREQFIAACHKRVEEKAKP